MLDNICHRALPFILALSTFAIPSQDSCAETWAFLPLPEGEYTSSAPLTKGRPSQIGDGIINDHAYWSPLNGTMIDISFHETFRTDNLAIVRSGWPDWAIPSKVALQINDQDPLIFDVNAPRQRPMPNEPIQYQRLDLGRTIDIEQLRVTVLDVELASRNTHGTFALGFLKRAPLMLDLKPVGGVPETAQGLKLELDVHEDMPSLPITAHARRFRRPTHWIAESGPLAKGEQTVVVSWPQFGPEEHLRDPIAPLALSRFQVGAAGDSFTLKSWSFVLDEHNPIPPAWEQATPVDFHADADGWRSGIPTEGFGRFGWMADNGLLVVNIDGNQFEWNVREDDVQESAVFEFHVGEADIFRWQSFRTDWTGFTQQRLYEYTAEMRRDLAAVDPSFFRMRRSPAVVFASILAPGFLVDSQDPRDTIFQMKLRDASQGGLSLLGNWGDQIAWRDVPGELDLDDLQEGWLILRWKDKPAQPILLAPAQRPRSIRHEDGRIVVDFDEPMGRIAIGTPTGYRPWTTAIQPSAEATDQLIDRSRRLAAILRAYPFRSDMRFKPLDGAVAVEERYSHLVWNNAWNESPAVVAPIAPLLRFAEAQGYPLSIDSSEIINEGIDTKYGPYETVPGHTLRYTLPTPEPWGTFYLAPTETCELGQQVTDHIENYFPRIPWIERDSLGSWWYWAPASGAFPLLSEQQREVFEANYRSELEHNMRPRTWHLRHEPHSRVSYPVSFGWIYNSTATLGDVNSGVGAAIFGPYAYARLTGNWDLIEERWPLLQGAFRYYLFSHDWNNMQTGAREFSGSSAIDMDGIGYQGAVAYWRMARQLGKEDDAAIAQLMVSRLAISTAMRWLGYRWVNPSGSKYPTTHIGIGFGENMGFDVMRVGSRTPNVTLSELALSLGWVGQYPELYRLHLWALGESFWRYYQFEFLENILPDWRKNHPGNRNNHPSNITINLYMRGLLGTSSAALREELSQQLPWGLAPGPIAAVENASFYAMLLGMDFPIRLHDWDGARVERAVFDSATNQAEIIIQSPRPFTLRWSVLEEPLSTKLNGASINVSGSSAIQELNLAPGSSRIIVAFDTP